MENEFNHKLLTTDNRDETLKAMWDALQECEAERAYASQRGLDFLWFCERWKNADVVGAIVSGQIVGGMIFDGVDVHIGILKEFWGRWAQCLKPMMEWGFATHGTSLKTVVPRENTRAIQFLERSGCVRGGENDKAFLYLVIRDNLYYRIREHRCGRGSK